jgi:hypothetical protein
MRPRSTWLAALPAALVVLSSALAYGQGSSAAAAAASQTSPAPPPLPPPGPASPGSYPAPLSQTTQETYVPQSVALSGPEEITDWQQGDPVPSGFHPVQRTRKGLIIAGAITFGALYLQSALVAAVVHDANANGVGTDNADALYVPVFGPFVQMARTTTATGNLLNVIDGVGQGAGLAMFIYGLTTPRTILVRNDLGMRYVLPVPYATSHSAGLAWVGTF